MPSRHAQLLDDEPLPSTAPPGADTEAWRHLRHLQLDFAGAVGRRERRIVLEEIADAIRELRRVRRPKLTPVQEITLRIGLNPRPYSQDPEVDREVRRR